MKRVSVAIVEDEPEFRNRFERIVEDEPTLDLVGSAADAASGTALIDRGAADVYLIDLGLPDGDGHDLIRRATRHRADVDVLVVTVFGDEAHVVSAIEAGATGYLLKDTEPEMVVEWIRTIRAGGSPLNPLIARQLLKRFKHAAAAFRAGTDPTGANASAGRSPVAGRATPPATPLSGRETDVLHLLAKGLSFAEIGRTLGISTHTVSVHIKSIYRKLSVHSRGEAVFEAMQMGIVTVNADR